MIKRSADQIKFHYEVEKELAARLRRATREERKQLYTPLYDELFRTVSDHPMLHANSMHDDGERMAHLKWLTGSLHNNAVYLELGPGDCGFASRVAAMVALVHAVDVTEKLLGDSPTFPDNLRFHVSDGTGIPIEDGLVDVAYSNQLMEHLHEDDARLQLEEVYRVLKPGGQYYCVTPSRFSGPHDISKYFSTEAEGFHLKEYALSDISAVFKGVGFRSVQPYMFFKGHPFKVPYVLLAALESILAAIPQSLAKPIARARPWTRILGLNVIATK
ncbi:MAG: class I SAM-dependent methyltransferase [Pseudomonadota bacterium]